jgi:hypothetical protein
MKINPAIFFIGICIISSAIILAIPYLLNPPPKSITASRELNFSHPANKALKILNLQVDGTVSSVSPNEILLSKDNQVFTLSISADTVYSNASSPSDPISLIDIKPGMQIRAFLSLLPNKSTFSVARVETFPK